MSLDLEQDDPIDYDSDEEPWCDDFWNLGTPRQRLEPIITRIGRSLEEILELEVRIIESCTDLDPVTWVHLYWEKFRKIVDEDSSYTESQIKRKLYFND